MLSKKNIFRNLIIHNNIFACPLCYSNLDITNNSLICKNGHCYDISNKGMITLTKNNKSNEKLYNKTFFEHRRKFITLLLYIDIYTHIAPYINSFNHKINLLDLGSGEGQHSYELKKFIYEDCVIFSVDISKDAIIMATDFLINDFVPVIGDLHNLPFKNKSFDIILNFLSPYSFKEVSRVLKDEGFFIKITPRKEYLKELREVFGEREYENEEKIESSLLSKLRLVNKKSICKTFSLENIDIYDLMHMTPLSYKKDKSIFDVKEITIALNIFVFKL